jgi:hypothetical protein
MAARSRTTFKKRQKELARLEKQRDKAARRMQRKLQKHPPEGETPGGGEAGTEEVDVTGAGDIIRSEEA